MSAKMALLAQQKNWAIAAGLQPDERGYLESVEMNLFRPLSATASQAFKLGSGSELVDTPSRPAKMKALHSSSALAVNVFDSFVASDSAPLAKAYGLESGIKGIVFEAQYPTGLPGNPPNLDIVLELDNERVVAIESKFSEWLTAQSVNKAFFKAKYFPPGPGLWAERGLPQSQTLAEAIDKKSAYFRYLDAAQLLKHALGLAKQLGPTCSLYYLYYACTGPESAEHDAELARFSQCVGGELGFKSLSYQSLFTVLKQAGGCNKAYLDYLENRYFGVAA